MPKLQSSPEKLFHALGDATRLAVVQQLCQRPQTVSQLALAHAMALPSFMQHLKVLEESGWISSTKTGRVRTCHLNAEALNMTGVWLKAQRELWERRLDQLDSVLYKLKQHSEEN